MKDLLPPHLKCKSRDPNIWVSNVIPAFKVRPMNQRDNLFAGYVLMVFAKKTKKHVVYDAQITQGMFKRTGLFTCEPTCDSALGYVCAGRLNCKDNFLKGNGEQYGYSVNSLSLGFYEDDRCECVPYMVAGPQGDFQTVVQVARGYDGKTAPKSVAYATISYVFNDCGKSLKKWVEGVNV